MEINGGIINGDIEVTTESELTINSGTIKGEINQDTSNTIVITNGGSFTTEPDATEIPADKEVVKNDDGTYTIQYKSADYTKVDEAINKANALNKDEYTTDSIKKLENAINVVNRSKNITEQAEVDKMATDIEAAIASLEKKTAIENPKTYDGIATAIGLTGISLIGLVGIYLKTKKDLTRINNEKKSQ